MQNRDSSGMAAVDPEKRVLETAQYIVRSLGTNNNAMTEDMIEILSKFDNRFNELLSRKNSDGSAEFSDSLESAEQVIIRWDKSSSDSAWQKMIWDSEEEAAEFLHAIDQVQSILDSLSLSQRRTGTERARSLLNVAMVRLLDEFQHLLETTSDIVDPARLEESYTSVNLPSFRSSGRDFGDSYREGDESSDEEEDEDVPVAEPVTDLNPILELLPPDVVESLHDMAKRLVQGEYKRECIQAYAHVRRRVIEESLQMLGMEKHSIDEVQRMQWDVLQGKIRKWIQVIDASVKVLFPSEKQLVEQVFDGIPGGVDESCFAEFARGIMIQLLNFGEAVAISRRETDKLITILDMYEKLRDVVPEIMSVFAGEGCLSVREEASGVLMRLGEAARGTFAEFENAIHRDPPKVPVPRGALHPLTRYVMNYLRLLLVYVDTLKELFTTDGSGDRSYLGSGSGSYGDEETVSPLAVQFIWIIHVLQGNLETKAKLYKDLALTNLFLMNNVHYIVQKVRNSEMRTLLGDDWMKKHTAQVRQHGKSYERAAWAKVLACLRDEGIRSGSSFSSGVSRAVLKERFKSFNTAFEEIHRVQSGWCVPDEQMRSELRISVVEKLVHAYRAFLGRYKIYLESERNWQKYIKYTPEELESMVNDLFSGS